MKKLRVGIVGFGFIGPHHLDAIRRLGFAEVTGIATISEADARQRAAQYYIPKPYATWQELVADPAIDVVDVATPTALHAPVTLAAIKAGKHVIVDKPVALTSSEAKKMHGAARRTGVVNAATFSIRYNVMLQQARALIARGDVGAVRLAMGHYWQEWLLKETDFNWRLEPEQGGALGMVSDAGAHWYDMVQHITGRRIVRVLADLSRFIPVRQRPLGDGTTVDYKVRVPDLGMILCEFDNGARGLFSTGAISAGHKNDLTIEVCGSKASVRWQQERPDELWIGRRDEPNQTWVKDPALLDPSVRPLVALPGGHAEAWSDAFRNLMRNILTFIAEGFHPRKPTAARSRLLPQGSTSPASSTPSLPARRPAGAGRPSNADRAPARPHARCDRGAQSLSTSHPYMSLRSWTKLFPAALLLSIVPRAIAAEKPNIVYILSDDLGYGDFGCYGQKAIATPHIDRLAADGMRFTQHYAGSSVCGPSRSCLLTGMHSGHARHRTNARFIDSEAFLPTDTTFAEVMKLAGYTTAICGKWHLGDRADTSGPPQHHGFDFTYCVGHPYPDGGVEHWPSHVFAAGVRTPVPENAGGRHGRYMDDLYTDAALRFLGASRDRPFLLYLALQGAHAPLDGAPSPRYATRDWPPVERTFAAMVEKVDDNVGRVLAELERRGLARNTVVFFSSDNGPHIAGGHDYTFFQSSGGLRGHKAELYEGGIRVPLIVRWPGVVAAGTTTDHVSAFWDMLPTFAELGGAKVPAGIDGLSLVPALRGTPQPAHAYLYWEFHESRGLQAVRWGKWKGVKLRVNESPGAPLQLYDLSADSAEQHDLAAQQPTVVAQLERFMAEAHVPTPTSALLPGEIATTPLPATKK